MVRDQWAPAEVVSKARPAASVMVAESALMAEDAETRSTLDGRGEFLPGGAAVGGAEDRAVAADEPADLIGVGGAGDEIGDDTAGLDGPSGARVGGALDHAGLADAPDGCAAGSGNAERSE